MQKWIGSEADTFRVGEVGYLVSREHVLRGTESWRLQDRPPYTNKSYEPRLHGWCGTDYDVATYGHGMARVVRIAKNGRALVQTIEGADLAEALEASGYPELADE